MMIHFFRNISIHPHFRMEVWFNIMLIFHFICMGDFIGPIGKNQSFIFLGIWEFTWGWSNDSHLRGADRSMQMGLEFKCVWRKFPPRWFPAKPTTTSNNNNNNNNNNAMPQSHQSKLILKEKNTSKNQRTKKTQGTFVGSTRTWWSMNLGKFHQRKRTGTTVWMVKSRVPEVMFIQKTPDKIDAFGDFEWFWVIPPLYRCGVVKYPRRSLPPGKCV